MHFSYSSSSTPLNARETTLGVFVKSISSCSMIAFHILLDVSGGLAIK